MTVSSIDLSKLPPPQFVETLVYENIVADMLADLHSRDKTGMFDSISEADPAYLVLEVAAYRELLIRQRGNEKGKALLLAFAVKTDLDHIGITYFNGEQRLIVIEADPEANPPIDAVYEDDESYRRRLLLKDDGYSTAGADNAYIFHALSVDGQIKDASVVSPKPGTTVVYILDRLGNGAADPEILAKVTARLNHQDIRPLSEEVLIRSASIIEWSLDADIYTYGGPDQTIVLDVAKKSFTTYITQHQMLGHDITLSGLYAALHVPGVFKVVLNSPLTDVVCDAGQAAWCVSANIKLAGIGQ